MGNSETDAKLKKRAAEKLQKLTDVERMAQWVGKVDAFNAMRSVRNLRMMGYRRYVASRDLMLGYDGRFVWR